MTYALGYYIGRTTYLGRPVLHHGDGQAGASAEVSKTEQCLHSEVPQRRVRDGLGVRAGIWKVLIWPCGFLLRLSGVLEKEAPPDI